MKKVNVDSMMATKGGFGREETGASLAGMVKEGLPEEVTVQQRSEWSGSSCGKSEEEYFG